MNMHKNAQLTFVRRIEMVNQVILARGEVTAIANRRFAAGTKHLGQCPCFFYSSTAT